MRRKRDCAHQRTITITSTCDTGGMSHDTRVSLTTLPGRRVRHPGVVRGATPQDSGVDVTGVARPAGRSCDTSVSHDSRDTPGVSHTTVALAGGAHLRL